MKIVKKTWKTIVAVLRIMIRYVDVIRKRMGIPARQYVVVLRYSNQVRVNSELKFAKANCFQINPL